MIVDLSREPIPPTLTCDVCVIGSGPGGATAARLLAEAGRDVVVLEEGGDRTGTQLTQRDGEMYDQLYMERGGRATDDLAVTVLQGRVLGGGAVINASDVVPTPDGVLAHWRTKFGLSDLTPEALAPHLDAALADLSANRIAEAQVNLANRLLRQGAQALGLRGEVMRHNRVGCQGLGTCLIGCPIGAKRTPRFVAIPAAMAAGARFFLRARAVRIDDGQSEIKRVRVRTLDERGYHERREWEVRARTVVVAASAIATPQLLLRSGLGNEHVGRHLMLQPQLPVTALFDERVDAFRGIPQAYAVTECEVEDDPEHGLWGFRIEAIMGTPGIASSLLPAAGHDGKRLMSRYGQMASSLLLVPDAPSGRVDLWGDGRPRIRYAQRADHKTRLREAVRMAARIYFAVGAREVWVPSVPAITLRSGGDLSAVDGLDFAPATVPLISAHQQGTVRMSPSPKTGAADPDGRLYGAKDVYVLDSSLFPSSASSHTMTPILTMSRWLTTKLAARSRG